MIIKKPYTNFVSIPIFKSNTGELYTDPLWAKDIKLHLDYINCFNLCCPVVAEDNIQNLENISHYKINNIFALRMDYGLLSIIKNLIPNFISVIRACKNSDIVHSGGAGWAFPLSYYILLLKPFFKFEWVIVIESSFWLLNKNEKITVRKVIEHITHKYILKLCVINADARIFTQSFYRTLFLGSDTKNTMINPASWVNQENILSIESYHLISQSKMGKIMELVFPTRLIEDKGVKLLFEAILLLKNMALEANITIVGNGPLKEEVIQFASKGHNKIKVAYFEPVEYGVEFYKLLQKYDLLLVPNLKEEQPRIIFDAFSQGIGVIASNTSGILDIVEPDKNAFIFKSGDAIDFANTIAKAIKNPSDARLLGLHGLNYAKGKTHAQMHQDRLIFLNSTLPL